MKKKLLIALMIVAIGIGIYFREYIDVEAIKQYIQASGWYAPIVFIVLYMLFAVFMLPASLLTILGGVLFGYYGILVNLIAAVIGCTVAFLISRYISHDWVHQHIIHDDASKTKKKVANMLRQVNQNGWQVVALLRLVPLVPFNLLNYILGLTTIPLGIYVLTSAIFMLPGTIAYTYIGILGDIALQGDTYNLIRGIIFAVSLFLGLYLVIRIVKNWRKKDIEQLDMEL